MTRTRDGSDVGRELLNRGAQAELAATNQAALARVGNLPLLVLATFGYAVLAVMGEELLPPDGISALWPAARFSAVLLLWASSAPRRALVLLGVGLGIGLSIAVRGMVFPNELGYLAGNVIEPVVMLPFLMRATRPTGRMDRFTSVAWLVLGAIVATATSAAVVASMATWSFDGTGDFSGTWPTTWAAFMTGDVLGLLLVAPLMLQAQPVALIWARGAAWEQALLWVCLGVALLLSWNDPIWLGAGLLVVFIIALRLEPAAASLAVFLFICFLIAHSLGGVWQTIPDSVASPYSRAAWTLVAVLTQLVSLSTNERISAQQNLSNMLEKVRRSEVQLACVAGGAPFGTALFDVVPSPADSPPQLSLAFTNAVGRPEGALDPSHPGTPELGSFYPDLVGHQLRDNLIQSWSNQAERTVVSDGSASGSTWAGIQELRFLPVGKDQVLVSWSDITQTTMARREAESARATAEAGEVTLRRALDTGLDAFAIYRRTQSAHWRLVFVNELGASHSGASPTDLVGSAPESVVPVEALGQVLPLMELAFFTQTPQKTVADFSGKADGWCGDFDIMASPIPDDAVVVTWRDITDIASTHRDLRSAHSAAMHAATHDPLTNLPNRLLLLDRLNTALALLPRTRQQLALAYLAVEGLDTIMNRYGHEVGDALLLRTSERLRKLLGQGDTAARLSGNEFVLLLTGLDERWNSADFHRKLAAELAAPISMAGQDLSLTASVGVVVISDQTLEASELLRRAGLAMSHSSGLGKGQLTQFNAALAGAALPGQPTVGELTEAIAHGQLRLVYQPIVDVQTAAVVGLEALVRWQHPRLGLLPPGQFLDLAETSGVITALGQWVLRAAIAEEASQSADHWVSINLAPTQILRADVAESIRDWCAQYRLDPHRLVLELTESQLLAATPPVLRQLSAIRALGSRIAIDDFGSGFSSIAYLETFEVDILKIDRALIAGQRTDRKRSLLAWIAGLAETLNCQTLAEGIEEPEQLDMVAEAGIQLGQGYLLGRPAPLAAPRQLRQAGPGDIG